MNFGNLAGIGGAASAFLATPEGQETVKNFLLSPEGTSLLKNFATTPDGQKVIMSILPAVLGAMNLPPGVADMIKGAIGGQQ
jgi:hypothetical protein